MAKILLVEDDKSLREIYGVRLMAEGYEIVSAGDGEEALAMAIKERPDLIVSDVMMPKISGFDMLDILRSTTETKDVKVIMMTALSSDDQRARGESLGADRYLVKSQVGIEDVVRTVHDVLGDSIGTAPVATDTPMSPPPADPVVDAQTIPAPEPAPAPAPDLASMAVPPTPVTPLPEIPVAESAPPVEQAPVVDTVPQAPSTPEPVPAPVEPAPMPAPETPAPTPEMPPVPQPAPVEPAPAPVEPAPAPAPAEPAPSTTLSELPANPAPLPQPTAPFSSPAPASLGQRVIEPLTNPAPTVMEPTDIASQMAQVLNDPNVQNPGQGTPPVPPAQ